MKRIAILGSECTGKTTLSAELADLFGTLWVPEYAREYSEHKPNLDIHDVLPIMRGQIADEEEYAKRAAAAGKDILICDTIPICSLAYSRYYNKAIPAGAKELAQRTYALYLLTDIDIPWQDDQARGIDIERPRMHRYFVEALENSALAYFLLSGNKEQRTEQAIALITQHCSAKAVLNHSRLPVSSW